MASKIPLPNFEESGEVSSEDKFTFAQLASKYVRLPEPKIIAELQCKPVFPTARQGSDRGKRNEIWNDNNKKLVLDDNASPVWALMWTHGYRDRPSGWRLAHIWTRASDPECFSNIANLCIIAAHLDSLTDGSGPLSEYLKYHSQEVYGWLPAEETRVDKPDGFDNIKWKYLKHNGCPRKNLNQRFSRLNNEKIRQLSKLEGMEHWRVQ